MFLIVLAFMTSSLFFGLFKMKKALMRRVDKERRQAEPIQNTVSVESSITTSSDESINNAIAHKLKADFYGSSFEMWSGGWSYSLMLSWSVLLRAALAHFTVSSDPWVEAWVYFAFLVLPTTTLFCPSSLSTGAYNTQKSVYGAES